MKMEEEKAIELAEEFTKMDFSNPMGWTGYYDTELNELSQAVQTVLNMLKEKDKKINSKSSSIKALQCALYERTEERDRKNNIIAKQNKMIDLMAEYLDEDDTSLANYLYRKNGKCNSEMVKQYFKSKAEKE